MPKIESDRIVFTPEDRQAISEQSPAITPEGYSALFNSALSDGDTTKYFKFLEEIAEKDPDILHTVETRSTYITSKEWTVVNEDGEQDDVSEDIEKELRNIAGDKAEGLLTVDGLINSLLGSSYLTGLSFAEIVTDDEMIKGFNHIPTHFLTFRESVYYPRLWTQEKHTGVELNQDKMISHYLTSGIDPARGWLGNGVAWQYVFKRSTLAARINFEKKYGKGFLLINMPGGKDSYEESWNTAEQLIENYSDTDGAVFEGDVEVDFKESIQSEGDYFFTAEEKYKQDITKIILGQESTSSSQDSNRSTADVHMEILEKRILEDSSAIEDTLTQQLVEQVKVLMGVSSDAIYEFKFVVSEMEATLDEELNEEGAVEETTTVSSTEEQTPTKDDEDNG